MQIFKIIENIKNEFIVLRGVDMKVVELVPYIFDQVAIYHESNINQDMYKGDIKSVPIKFLEAQVNVIGAQRKGIIDIEIK